MTIYTFSRLASAAFQTMKHQSSRPLFYWVTLAFNRVDADRVKEVGPDRACAEWLLRNGGSVRWKGFHEHLTDYNALPEGGTYYIEAVDADNAGICDVGFLHFDGCKHIIEVKLQNCVYVNNKAIQYLSFLKDTLTNVEIIKCRSVDEIGLRTLKALKNLETLKIQGVPGVTDKSTIRKELAEALPNCKIDFQ